ncbi:uncharacterized protein LOC121770490 [Salvia splendens]|uniref:uncharacterized protein LOC121770490 n=1 Tax=Salvia splendens TaxID=180675 RepID=UPI001C25B822|nr:uncharacterized protein LOC121770490 [Salvia splendens]
MNRFSNNGEAVWGGHRPDSFSSGASQRQNFNLRHNEVFQRQAFDEGDLEGRPPGDSNQEETLSGKMDRLLEKMDKFDQWKDETDRKFKCLDPLLARETEPPLGFDEADDGVYEELRRWKSMDRGGRVRNPTGGYRDGAIEDRGFRPDRSNDGSAWDVPGNRYTRPAGGNLQHQFEKPASCWDPPQRYHSSAAGVDKNQVSMKPPRFDGSDATNWISRVNYYFDHVMMPEAQRLHYAVMLFDPPASEWVFNYCGNNDFVTWQDFLEDVRHRFDRQSFKDYFELIAKLTQTGTVLEYHDTFERYLNRVQGVPESKLFTLYVAGLKPDMQERVTLHRPTSLAAAMALSLALADSHSDRTQVQLNSGFQRRTWQGRDTRATTAPPGHQPAAPAGATSGLPSGTQQHQREQTRQPTIRVSQAERSECSRLGLCWHCPEKWVVGHVCKQRMLCYADEEEVSDGGKDEVREEEISSEVAHIHSLDGGRRSRPLKVLGHIHDREVCILVDTGSDRDFLHPKIAESLHLPLSPIRPFRVFVGNGAALLCTHMAVRTKLRMQGCEFVVDLHILPIHGPDVILGMDWLESLGQISADFAQKTLEFNHKGQSFTLRGILPPPRRLTAETFLSMHSSADMAECFEIALLKLESDESGSDCFPSDLPGGVAAVLESFLSVFRVPTGMPPVRQYDHRIHLLPGSKPVNVQPYRYPYFQKNEIERQVREMLEQGIIQRSNSPFSSPVLLIRKKDGSFRFCIDYRALNNVTVPDHFPIPTVDELFDELGKARFFSKLDLRSGYHQIRMHDEDVFKTAFRIHDGHFEFLVMPFGQTNAPSTFQAAMNSIFQHMMRKFVIVFFDDILIYSPSVEEHASHLSDVLTVLREHNFFVKLSKCSFCSPTVEYLGHLITDGLLKADPVKIEAMTAWPVPKNVKQLRGFLGLTGYYRRQYAFIAAPMTNLLKKDAFCWTAGAEESFHALKKAMTRAPVLRLPDFEKPFCVEIDASDSGIGAVLLRTITPLLSTARNSGLGGKWPRLIIKNYTL